MISRLVLPSAMPALRVGAGALAVAQSADGDHVQGAVGVAVAAVVEAVAVASAGGDGDRAGAAEGGEGAVAVQALDVLAGGDEELAGVAGRDGDQPGGAWRGGGDQRREPYRRGRGSRGRARRRARASERSASLAACSGSCRRARSGRSRGAERWSCRAWSCAGELLAQLVGRGDDHLGQLIERRGARLDRAVAREPELADRLDDPVGALRHHRRVPGQRLASGHLGVDRVALASPPARVRVRAVDFDDRDAARAQIAHQAGRVGTGRLDADDARRGRMPQARPAAPGCRRAWSRRSERRAVDHARRARLRRAYRCARRRHP